MHAEYGEDCMNSENKVSGRETKASKAYNETCTKRGTFS